MDEQITIDQHYVPRFYMKNFANIKGKGKKEKVLISFYQFEGGLCRDNVPVKSICYKKFFYGEDGTLEKELAEKENKWSSSIHEVLEYMGSELSIETRKNLKEFGIYQCWRTLATLNHAKETMSELVTTHLVNNNHGIDEKIVKSMVDEKINSEIESPLIVELCQKLVDEIEDLDISIVKFVTPNKLITSDAPVIIINPFSENKAGLKNVGFVMMYPISDDMLVVIYDNKIYKNCKPYMLIEDEKDVINLNKYQIISAEERIMSRSASNLVSMIADNETIQKRIAFYNKRKVNSSYDGVGTLFATSSRSMNYDFSISFFKLPKYLCRIPIEYREAFNREYSFDARMNLLCRVYRLPDILKENKKISKSEIKKMKKSYSEIQKIMDDYWGIPLDKRTITSDMMDKLKTVPATFYPNILID